MAVEPFLGTRAQRVFVGTIFIQAIIVVTIIAIVFARVAEKVAFAGLYKTIPCYLALFVLAEIFEMLMVIDAMYMRNIIQLLGIVVFHLGLMITAALQVHETRIAVVRLAHCDASVDPILCGGQGTLWSRVLPLLIVSPCFIGVSWLALCFYMKDLYAEFGWAIFHAVGANPKMKQMYRHYQILICLLKFDFFFFTGVTMQLLIIVLQHNSSEFGVTIAAIPVVLLLLFLCGIAVQREIYWIMNTSLSLMLASLAYFVYKLFRFFDPSSREQYATTRATLTVFTVVAFLLVSASLYFGVRCLLDFDKGLLDSKVKAIQQRRPGQSQKPSSDKLPGQYEGGAPLAGRVSIE